MYLTYRVHSFRTWCVAGVEAVRVGAVVRGEDPRGAEQGARRHQEGRLPGRRLHLSLDLRAFPR